MSNRHKGGLVFKDQIAATGANFRERGGVRPFLCVECNRHAAGVAVDSRPRKSGGMRRRRQCEWCGARFTTIETVATLVLPGRPAGVAGHTTKARHLRDAAIALIAALDAECGDGE